MRGCILTKPQPASLITLMLAIFLTLTIYQPERAWQWGTNPCARMLMGCHWCIVYSSRDFLQFYSLCLSSRSIRTLVMMAHSTLLRWLRFTWGTTAVMRTAMRSCPKPTCSRWMVSSRIFHICLLSWVIFVISVKAVKWINKEMKQCIFIFNTTSMTTI